MRIVIYNFDATLTFHTNDSLSSMQLHPSLLRQDLLSQWRHETIKLSRKGISKHRMSDEPFSPEKGVHPDSLCPINDLIRNDEMPRSDLLSERTNRRECDDGFASDVFQCGDVGSSGDFGGGDVVRCTVARDECDKGPRGEGGDCNWG